MFGANDVDVALDGAGIPLVAEAERDNDEEDVEHEHDDTHALCHLPLERDDCLKKSY